MTTFAFSVELQGSYYNIEIDIDCDDDGNTCEQSIDVDVVLLGEQLWTLGAWNSADAESYCYDNDKRNCSKYGALFTYKDAQNLCPEHFHLPNENDFKPG